MPKSLNLLPRPYYVPLQPFIRRPHPPSRGQQRVGSTLLRAQMLTFAFLARTRRLLTLPRLRLETRTFGPSFALTPIWASLGPLQVRAPVPLRSVTILMLHPFALSITFSSAPTLVLGPSTAVRVWYTKSTTLSPLLFRRVVRLQHVVTFPRLSTASLPSEWTLGPLRWSMDLWVFLVLQLAPLLF